MSNLLRHHGIDMSEPMAFGLASGITYAYIGPVKINGLPLLAYRMPPRMIIRLLARRIAGLEFRFEKFANPEKAMAALDRKLTAGEIVGLQTSVFFLPYFPPEMRFHFNAHNLLVYGKDGDEYRVSDPVFSDTVVVDPDSLSRARFSRGALAPKGMMYYPTRIPDAVDYEKVIPKAIRFTARLNGSGNPAPFCGVSGMRMVARKIERLPNADPRFAKLFLGHLVRMQEEIGTGGAGFRFMYAAFLQEAGEMLQRDELIEASRVMTQTGDEWRQFALLAARMSKSRGKQEFIDVANKLRAVASMEESLYAQLREFKHR